MSPAGSLQGGIVGKKQTIHCGINIVSGVTVNSVIVNWIGPERKSVINSDRITITTPTISSGNYITSSLEFMYLMEGDEGTYVCNVSILQTSTSIMVELGALTGKNQTEI